MRGRKAKPTQAHVIEGTFDKSRHSDRADIAVSNSRPIPPQSWDDYDPMVKRIWDFYFPRLYWNSETESHMFLRFCHMTADHENFMLRRKTEYDWKPAMLAELSKISASLGIGYSEKMKIPPPDDGSKKDKEEKEDFD